LLRIFTASRKLKEFDQEQIRTTSLDHVPTARGVHNTCDLIAFHLAAKMTTHPQMQMPKLHHF
jgi:hypothetical protein